jgi:hypothetical protein
MSKKGFTIKYFLFYRLPKLSTYIISINCYISCSVCTFNNYFNQQSNFIRNVKFFLYFKMV